MTVTDNLGLSIYDTASGSATTFLTFRLLLAGNSSNMILIDNFAGETSASILNLKSNAVINVGASEISSNYYESTVSSIESYQNNSMINLKLNTTNTGAVTININGLGIVTLKKIDVSGNLVDISYGDLKLNRYYLFIYNGTYYILMSPSTGDQVSINGIQNRIVTISASGVLQDSGTSSSSVMLGISGSGIMSSTAGSSIIHNTSGITSGSYNKVIVDAYGHVTAGSQINYQTISSISGSDIMSDTTGSVVKHNTSGITAGSYVKIIVDKYGHITTGSITYTGIPVPLVSKTDSYVLLDSDYVCISSGSATITLPNAIGKFGRTYNIKNSGSLVVSIISASGLIDSASQVDLSTLQSIKVISDNVNWWKL